MNAAANARATDRGETGATGAWRYTNPVIKGDWSDPAVVRVGEDYYSLRSTFGWQPGLALAHSKDLVHWQYVGDGFSALPSLATGEVGGGIWGSELIYNSNTQMFMIYATYNGVAIFESAKPEGPYTQVPGGLRAEGYDPGVLVDDDGRVYMASSTGKIAELSKDGKSVINPSVSSYAEWNEGPELFKRAPYYYVTWSSNGTERGADGIVNSARSRSLAGPWQRDPANPVMQNLRKGNDRAHPFEGPQHPSSFKPRMASGSSPSTRGNGTRARWLETCASSPSSGRLSSSP
jgi:xylan 1,4-beta-xylosidase